MATQSTQIICAKYFISKQQFSLELKMPKIRKQKSSSSDSDSGPDDVRIIEFQLALIKSTIFNKTINCSVIHRQAKRPRRPAPRKSQKRMMEMVVLAHGHSRACVRCASMSSAAKKWLTYASTTRRMAKFCRARRVSRCLLPNGKSYSQ